MPRPDPGFATVESVQGAAKDKEQGAGELVSKKSFPGMDEYVRQERIFHGRDGWQIRLHDGRLLGYAEYGDPTGKPVFLFQGTPSSRLLHPDKDLTRSLGARLIVMDRPGFGLSDFQPGRRLLDWPSD